MFHCMVLITFSGLVETCYAVGFDGGTSLMGILFNAFGTQTTLLIYSVTSGLILVILFLYIHFSKHVDDYEKVCQDSDEE